jgi:hypothetical protein
VFRVVSFVISINWTITYTLQYFLYASDVPGARNEFNAYGIAHSVGTAVLLMLTSGFLSDTRVRKGVQRLLAGSSAGNTEEANAAAGVSAAIGNVDVHAALAAAVLAFRCISFDMLTASDLDTNAAAPDLNKKAEAARLGGVDFFFSHSWHDSSANKVGMRMMMLCFKHTHTHTQADGSLVRVAVGCAFKVCQPLRGGPQARTPALV